MDLFRVVLSVVVLIAVAVFILLFERKRATRIERDLRDMAVRRRRTDKDGDGDGAPGGPSHG